MTFIKTRLHAISMLVAALLLPLSPIQLQAGETGYEIELIIFEDVQSRYIRSEQWSYNDRLNQVIAEKNTRTVKDDPEYKHLKWEEAKLASNLQHMLNNPNFRVLATKRWRQTGLDRQQTYDIDIDSRDKALAPPAPKKPGGEKPEQQADPLEQAQLQSYIAGTVKLVMSRYLHFNVNLTYYRPQQSFTETAITTEYKPYPVVEERRMKSKEVHYLDHPMVGIVVLATPYKLNTPDGADKTLSRRR